MVNKHLLNALMIAIGLALVVNPSTNQVNPALMRALTWFFSGVFKK